MIMLVFTCLCAFLLMRVLLVFAYVLCFFSFAMMLPFRRNKDEYIKENLVFFSKWHVYKQPVTSKMCRFRPCNLSAD